MAEAANPATPPASSGGIDTKAIAEAVAAAVAAAVPAAIVEANRPITEALAKLQPQQPAAAAAGGDKAKPLTADDVKSIVGDAIKGFQQTSQQADQRRTFTAEKMKDLPAAYQDKLGPDPAKWAAEEQSIRQQFRNDLAGLGLKAPDATGQPPASAAPAGTQKPGAVVDISKLNTQQLIQEGLRREAAAGPTAAVTTRTQPVPAGA